MTYKQKIHKILKNHHGSMPLCSPDWYGYGAPILAFDWKDVNCKRCIKAKKP